MVLLNRVWALDQMTSANDSMNFTVIHFIRLPNAIASKMICVDVTFLMSVGWTMAQSRQQMSQAKSSDLHVMEYSQ